MHLQFAVVGALVGGALCGCKYYKDGKQRCPADAPCCYSGYCDATAYFCLAGNCEPADSFSDDSCDARQHCVDYADDFNDGSVLTTSLTFTGSYDTQQWISAFSPDYASVDDGALRLELRGTSDANLGFGATVYHPRWVDFGRVSARIKSGSSGLGVVSSFILRNEYGDEVDFEWVGAQPRNVQSNYYWNNEEVWTNMIPSPELDDTSANYHEYAIDWQPDAITWYVDKTAFRTLNKADTWSEGEQVFKFPSREMRLSFSIWDGGNSVDKGTREWAGEPTSYADGRSYAMLVDSVSIECSSLGNATVAESGSSGSSGSSGGSSSSGSSSSSGGSSPGNTPDSNTPATTNTPAATNSPAVANTETFVSTFGAAALSGATRNATPALAGAVLAAAAALAFLPL